MTVRTVPFVTLYRKMKECYNPKGLQDREK